MTAWRRVPFATDYEVSDTGVVRSFKGATPRVLQPTLGKRGYLVVGLAYDGRHQTWPMHRLVSEAFLGELPPGLETRHLDGDHMNNALYNLRYGTRSENEQDKVRHGTHNNAKKTHCPRDHRYDEANTITNVRGFRICRQCKAESSRRYKQKLRAA